MNSAVYTLNDWRDAATDRLHPTKRHRPLAAGRVPPAVAAVQICVLVIVGFGLCWLADTDTALGFKAHWRCGPALGVSIAYLIINLAYSFGAKHIVLLDVFLLSSGFVLRVLLGCALVSAVPSPWLLLCTGTLALFLGFTKRRADLTEELDLNHRPSLRGYSKAFLDQAVSICAGVAILAYALYCIEAKKVLLPGPRDGFGPLCGLRHPQLLAQGRRRGRRRVARGHRLSLRHDAALRTRLAGRRRLEPGPVVKGTEL